jgi:glutathione S-transferase
MITLYSDDTWISPYVFSVWVALKEKGLEFEVRELALDRGEHQQPGYRDRSITAKVPAIEDGGFFLAESLAILEYLEDVYGPPGHPPLFPAGVRERARARQVCTWIRSDLLPLREERPTTTMFYKRTSTPLSKEGEAAAAKLVRVANLLVPAEGSSLFGAWSIADADLAFMLHRLILNGHELPPKVRSFAQAQWARASVRSYVERSRPPSRE